MQNAELRVDVLVHVVEGVLDARPGQAEVAQPHLAIAVDENIGRLHASMHDIR